MWQIIKLISGLLAGMAGGFIIAAAGILLFTDTTLPVFLDKLMSADVWGMACAALVGVVSLIVSVAFLVISHEAGHLVCGLLTGYEFVSFRIFNITFIKVDGKLRLKRYSIAGTGGQCLLSPPDLPVPQIPVVWYNAGGVLANFLFLLIALPLLWADLNPFVFEGLVIFCIVDGLMILFNGIPMVAGGIGNDGYNMWHLHRNMRSKHALVVQLRSNALIQDGVRPKDMPGEWFISETGIDYRNSLEVSVPLMHASRLVDEMKWAEAYLEFNELYGHRDEIMPLYVNEIACELAFCAMVTGRKEMAAALLDKKLMQYIKGYSKVMSSKQRILCAAAFYLESDKEKADGIYRALEASKDAFLLQGEVESDLAIMKEMFSEGDLKAIGV